MTNLPITTSNTLAATSTGKSAQAKNDKEPQSGSAFGDVLSRQVEANNAPAKTDAPTNTTPAEQPTTDARGLVLALKGKGKLDALAADVKTDPLQTQTAAINPADAASSLVAMLQIPQEIKTPVVADAANAAQKTVATDTAASLVGIGLTGNNPTLAPAKAGVNLTGEKDKPLTTLVGEKSLNTKDAAVISDATNNKPNAVATLAIPQDETRFATIKPEELNRFTQHLSEAQTTTPTLNASMVSSTSLNNTPAVNNPQTINAPVGSSKWPDEFSQKVSWVSTQQNQIAELHLNPPDLGPMNVTLKISDNQATALFTSPHGAVREAIENAIPKLREILADNGITLGNTTVSDQTPRDNGASAFTNQRNNQSSASALDDDDASTNRMQSTIIQPASARKHNGMVDTFA